MVNVPFQEESWFVLLQKLDNNSVLVETLFCVTDLLLQNLVSNCGNLSQTHGDLEKHIEKKHQIIWPGLC